MAAHTIALKGDYIRKEAEASGAITPGHLVQFGGSKDLQAHANAAAQARAAFALENDLFGKGIDDDYALGQMVQYGVFDGGAEVYALIAAGQNVSKGAKLVSAGNGTLENMPSGAGLALVGWAMEAVNNTSSFAARIRVEVA